MFEAGEEYRHSDKGRGPKPLQCSSNISIDREFLLSHAEPVSETPQLTACWRYFDVGASLVSDLAKLVFRLEGAEPSFG